MKKYVPNYEYLLYNLNGFDEDDDTCNVRIIDISWFLCYTKYKDTKKQIYMCSVLFFRIYYKGEINYGYYGEWYCG